MINQNKNIQNYWWYMEKQSLLHWKNYEKNQNIVTISGKNAL